ncbi:MAG: hypothetical protein IT348_05765 [Candidatus Eisenbacteria bacterium]|nr:hypothetical protein [Candidatus Eisenbacteria bacterium]
MARQTYAPRGAIKSKPDPKAPTDPKADDRPRCTAHSRTSGQRCAQPPIRGGTVCRFHGGSAPQVKQKAAERLMAYQDKAISRLFELAEQTQFPSTALAAVKDVLDRTEGKATERIDMNVTGELSTVPARLAAARKRLAQKP